MKNHFHIKNIFNSSVSLLLLMGAVSACNPDNLSFVSPSPTPGGSATPTTTPVVASISFSPAGGAVGTLVTITGANGADLSTTTGVTIGGVTATPLSTSTATVVALVMPGSITGTVTLTNATTTFSAPTNFALTVPSVIANQQGAKNAASNTVGSTIYMGSNTAVSADGNTALFGADGDSSFTGAAWIFTRSGTTWTQQAKLVGADEANVAPGGYFGTGASLSADGNTAVVGGYFDNYGVGAAFVFTRVNGVWAQQGSKLIGTGGTVVGWQGNSVSLSADGNTLVVAGYHDNSYTGAFWVFTRIAGVWSQQGGKITGAGEVGVGYFATTVGISGDGSTIFSCGYGDNSSVGAIWVYTLQAGVWTLQGSKLVPTGNTGASKLGYCSISMDGNTIAGGGPGDNSSYGAVFMFTRTAGVWTQYGTKLLPSDATGSPYFGRGISLSADASTLLVTGYKDNSNIGASWIFRNIAGVWTQQGTKLVGTGSVGSPVQGLTAALSADGTTAVVSGDGDNSNQGAFWVFTP
jgi:hypothetical protein